MELAGLSAVAFVLTEEPAAFPLDRVDLIALAGRRVTAGPVSDNVLAQKKRVMLMAVSLLGLAVLPQHRLVTQ